MTLLPSYGRDYDSKKAVLKDWKDGKDFKICDMFSPHDGKQCSIADRKQLGGFVQIRYKNLTRIVAV